MVFSILVNGILGLAMVIFLLFCLGDIDKALESPTKYPFIEIFYQGVRNSKAGAIALVSLIEVLLIFCCISLMAASSRMMWAFARDKGLPGWQYLSRVIFFQLCICLFFLSTLIWESHLNIQLAY